MESRPGRWLKSKATLGGSTIINFGGGSMPFKFDVNTFVGHPLLTSLLVADIGILMFMPLVRPPVVLNMLFVGGLIYLSMYFGAKLVSRE
ncbi:hypothetical protein MCA2103 [Methylococcus capsulatus str. Bath]|uniref:Uncharacterized protein n=1 Tax=Methylococcus capsulatus (strain ATCC 33009 / NCIMB 11132 / Bath) TaxID=243233 RepID=Q606B5_METCA|nr:hypothetical protein MCA2103 [Methylococcus capsulatus str. Bath]